MRSAVIYYSYNGNTRKVAWVLSEFLAQQGQVKEIDITALDESKNFFAQCTRARKHVRAQIKPAEFNLMQYDLICFGTPVWAFAPSPAMNAYLDSCFGLSGKTAVLFSTYGGAGKERCLDYMQELLAKKGVKEFKRFSIQQAKVKDAEFVLSEIKKII
jgi:flavodoxin